MDEFKNKIGFMKFEEIPIDSSVPLKDRVKKVAEMTFAEFVDSVKNVVEQIGSDETFYRMPIPLLFLKGTDQTGKSCIQICALLDGLMNHPKFMDEGLSSLVAEYKATSFAFASGAVGYRFDDAESRDEFSDSLREGFIEEDDLRRPDQVFLILITGDAEATQLWLNKVKPENGSYKTSKWERAQNDESPLVTRLQQVIRENL